jgi:hypothetical protein
LRYANSQQLQRLSSMFARPFVVVGMELVITDKQRNLYVSHADWKAMTKGKKTGNSNSGVSSWLFTATTAGNTVRAT